LKHITKFSLNPKSPSTVKMQRAAISRDDAPSMIISREEVHNFTPEMKRVLEYLGCRISYDPIHMVYEVLTDDPEVPLAALNNDGSWRFRLYNE
jgi:hypothetical protein